MERTEAVEKLQQLKGKEFHELAQEYGVTIYSNNGKVNKGWAGHVCERYLGLPLNSSQSPNFGSWELKVIPLKTLKNGKLVFKETMQITMIDPVNVRQKEFEESHLLAKLKKEVIVARTVGKTVDEPSYIHSVVMADLSNGLYDAVKADYDLVRNILLDDTINGFNTLTGRMGVYIQPRTKGAGHGSTSRAFYAKKKYLGKVIDI